jgi:NADPH:quinone reductase-like Zn-dependent oxidoreductase
MVAVPRTMEAIRLHAPGVDGLRHETIDTPSLQLGEALVEVHAAAITRDELEGHSTGYPRFPPTSSPVASPRSQTTPARSPSATRCTR